MESFGAGDTGPGSRVEVGVSGASHACDSVPKGFVSGTGSTVAVTIDNGGISRAGTGLSISVPISTSAADDAGSLGLRPVVRSIACNALLLGDIVVGKIRSTSALVVHIIESEASRAALTLEAGGVPVIVSRASDALQVN